MIIIEAIIGFIIVLLLIRLLIRPIEANYNQIFSLLYRLTDPILVPARVLFKSDLKAVLLSVFILVIIRGFLYALIKPISIGSGTGISFLNLFRLLFQFYMVVWFIAILTGYRTQTSVISMGQRAFLPISYLSSRLGIPVKHFSLFSFAFLLLIYSALGYLLQYIIPYSAFKYFPQYMLFRTLSPSFTFFHAIAEGLILIIVLFPFPGFFSLVIIVGVLLSWVSPDPYNPVVQTVYGISEPLLAPFRRFIPSLAGLDFSPLIALICFNAIGVVLLRLIGSVLSVI